MLEIVQLATVNQTTSDCRYICTGLCVPSFTWEMFATYFPSFKSTLMSTSDYRSLVLTLVKLGKTFFTWNNDCRSWTALGSKLFTSSMDRTNDDSDLWHLQHTAHVNIVSSWTWKILKLPFKLFLLTENSVRGQCGHLWGHPGLCQQGATEGKKNLFSPSVITSKVFTKSKFFLFRCYQNILESNFSCFIYSSFSVSDLINASVSSETTNRLINSELNHLILSRDI